MAEGDTFASCRGQEPSGGAGSCPCRDRELPGATHLRRVADKNGREAPVLVRVATVNGGRRRIGVASRTKTSAKISFGHFDRSGGVDSMRPNLPNRVPGKLAEPKRGSNRHASMAVQE